METNPRECLFCHNGLPVVEDQPVNLAFLEHIDANEPCNQAFTVWTDNMQSDYLGG